MADSDFRLRHLPFFEEMATHDEGTPEWRTSTAGLVVLRLVDAWLADGASVIADDAWGVRSVEACVEDIDEGNPVRAILGRVVDSLREQKPDIHVVITPLMAYAQTLEYDAKWFLAADVYHSVLAHLHPSEDCDASIAAHLRLGSCYRNLHDIPAAAAAFEAASNVAIAVGDIVGVLRARVGEARIAILRGNLPKAEEILDETIARATGESLRDVRSRALHDRSEVANRRGNYELAIQLAYEALQHSHAPTERDRILGDIAGSFLDLGVYSAARDAYLVISATAQEQYARWTATLNLMEIASHSGAEVLFEQYRRQLGEEKLPPYLETGLQIVLGSGYQRFGDPGKARSHFERGVVLAKQYDLNQFLFQAEEALFTMDQPASPIHVQEAVPLAVAEVAQALRDLRESVGVG